LIVYRSYQFHGCRSSSLIDVLPKLKSCGTPTDAPIMRLHIVKVAFDATTYAKLPRASKRFEIGEVVVFLQHPEGTAASTLFALRSAGNRKDPCYDPYITTDEIFQTHTVELPHPATKTPPIIRLSPIREP
jgi:hypothetical protein